MAKSGVNQPMRRSMIRNIGAASILLPMIATCTQPQGMIASASEHLGSASEDRLIRFLIDGDAAARRPNG